MFFLLFCFLSVPVYQPIVTVQVPVQRTPLREGRTSEVRPTKPKKQQRNQIPITPPSPYAHGYLLIALPDLRYPF